MDTPDMIAAGVVNLGIIAIVFLPEALKGRRNAKIKLEEQRTEQARELTKQKERDLEIAQVNLKAAELQAGGQTVNVTDERQSDA